VTEQKRGPLELLDGLRGLTAIYVMLGHAIVLLTVDGTRLDMSAGAGGVMSLVFRHGHLAVLIFFLISGFCIHYRQAGALAVGQPGGGTLRFSTRLFARRRLQRLVPPLLAALILTAGLDYLGAAVVNPNFYAGTVDFWTSSFFATASHSGTTFIGNLFFQGSFVVQPFGTNGPLWSLAFEFWFYVLYPVLLWFTTRFGPASLLIIPGAAAIVAYGALPADQPAPGGGLGLTAGGWWVAETLLYWIVWTAGAVIAEAYVGRFRVPTVVYIAGVAAIATARWLTPPASPTWIGGWMINDLLWSAFFAIGLSLLLVAVPLRVPHVLMEWATYAGKISYSLYLVHIPVIAFVSACWFAAGRQMPIGLELALPTAVLALGVAILMWFIAERPFQRSRTDRFTIDTRAISNTIALSRKGSPSA
jgi:peptidoglycan/LPS O-acetylase OafA/YrhL